MGPQLRVQPKLLPPKLPNRLPSNKLKLPRPKLRMDPMVIYISLPLRDDVAVTDLR